MPRDGSNIYHRPVGTDAVTDTSIESTKYNNFVADVEQDLNWPRPIVAGGTGATNAHDAMVALGGEIAAQHVDNYDSFPFADGDFYSQPGATGGPPFPNTQYLAGVCYGSGLYATMLEARDLGGNPNIKFTRCKVAGTWGAWQQENAGTLADTDARYVNVAGDSMSGQLNMLHVPITLTGSIGSNDNDIISYKGAATRWLIRPGDATAESGGNAGSNFEIYAFNDAGTAVIGPALTINRANLDMTTGGSLVVNGQMHCYSIVWSADTPTSGGYYFGNSGSASLRYDSGAFQLHGGPLTNWGAITSALDATHGTYYFGSNDTSYLNYDGAGFTLAGGNLNLVGAMYSQGGVYSATGAKTGVFNFGSDGTHYIVQDGANYIFGAGDVRVNGNLWAISGATTGTLYFGSNATQYLTCDGSNFNLHGGGFTCSGDIVVRSSSPTTGTLWFGGNATKNITMDGSSFIFNGGQVFVNGNGVTCTTLTANGVAQAYGYLMRQGLGGGFGTNWFNFFPISGGFGAYIDNTYWGNISFTSDYRIKKDVLDLPGMWDTVKGLRPIKYTHQDFTPPSEYEASQKTGEPFMKGDDVERWGFIAHELQETLIESAATGVKDAPDAVQSPNPWTVIAALTKALQEAMTRIEALEGAGTSQRRLR